MALHSITSKNGGERPPITIPSIALLLLVSMSFGATLDIPNNVPTKLQNGINITTSEVYTGINVNSSEHYYVVRIPNGNINVAFNLAKIQRLNGNVTLKNLTVYPITNESAYLNKTRLTYGNAVTNINTAVSRKYLIRLSTDPFQSGTWGGTIGAFYFDPDITGCGSIDSSGNYVLIDNIAKGETAETYCIFINANDININCQGYEIDGGDFVGIQNYGYERTTIENCNVKGTGYALEVELYSVETSSFLINSNFTTQNGIAIYLSDAPVWNLTGVMALSENSNAYSGVNSYGVRINNSQFYSWDATAFVSTGDSYGNVINNSYFEAYSTGICIEITSNNNIITQTNFVAASGTLLDIAEGATGNLIYWNIFNSTSGYYVDDESIEGNFYNTSTEGNIWGNTNWSYLTGTNYSSYYSTYKIATGGSMFPYDETTADGKLNCGNYDCVDYHPLFYSPICNGTLSWGVGASPDGARLNYSTPRTFIFPIVQNVSQMCLLNTTCFLYFQNGSVYKSEITTTNSTSNITVTGVQAAGSDINGNYTQTDYEAGCSMGFSTNEEKRHIGNNTITVFYEAKATSASAFQQQDNLLIFALCAALGAYIFLIVIGIFGGKGD